MSTQEQWLATWRELGAAAPAGLYEELMARYAEPHRHYHTTRHLEECFAELRKLDPDIRAIVASGYDNDDIARSFLDKGFCGFLTKPYRVTDLGKVLKTVIG